MPSEPVNLKSIDAQLERSEAEAVLSSEILKRAHSLRQILAYVCDQYFAGNAANIKEYNIAVEALGRSADFDPNANTIVRVEASRLRKRLKQYYETEGADHSIQLILPSSGYVPQFVQRPAGDEPLPVQNAPAARQLPLKPALIVIACLAVLVPLAFKLPSWLSRLSAPAGGSQQPTATSSVSGGPPGDTIRILSGYSRPQFVDGLGRVWQGDRYYQGGSAREWVKDIVGVVDPTMYRTARIGTSFRYDIPLKPGIYELRLMFAEQYFGQLENAGTGEGSRVFDITINDVLRLHKVDIFADVGAANTPADRVLKDISPASDGYLHLAFQGLIDWATISGIEIIPSVKGKIWPIRIVAGGRSYFDRAGTFWGADRYFVGGRQLRKAGTIEGTEDPELYCNQRWGQFNYSIPVAPDGKYGLTLKFAEMNYGNSNSGKGGVGSRVFDVYCNGVALLRNFDIYKEAGGENRALDKTFHGLAPNDRGRLVLTFDRGNDYASLSSIQVVDESR